MAQHSQAGPYRSLVNASEGVGFFPSAPESSAATPNVGVTIPAGVFACGSASMIVCDVIIAGPQSATGTVDILAWDQTLAANGQQGWVIDTSFTIQNTPAVQRFKTPAQQWCSRWAYARVTALGTAATSYSVALLAVIEGG